jgi:hypothetical protein
MSPSDAIPCALNCRVEIGGYGKWGVGVLNELTVESVEWQLNRRQNGLAS